MFFGKTPGDYRDLAGVAHATLLNARKACGDGDVLTLSISSLYHVLFRLSASFEVSEMKGGVTKRDGDNRWRELATLARDCAHLLKLLNQVLGKFNMLPIETKNVTKLWRRIKFGNGETLDLDEIQPEMGAYAQAINLFLALVEQGTVGEVEGYMDTHGAELRELKHTLHWVIAKLLALEGGDEEGICERWKASMKAGSLLEIVKEHLIEEGWTSEVLERHQTTVAHYFAELGERGILDVAGVALHRGFTTFHHNASSVVNKRSVVDASNVGHCSESNSDSDSSFDKDDGIKLTLGERRLSTVSVEKIPKLQAIGPFQGSSSLVIDASEDDLIYNNISAPIMPKSVAQISTVSNIHPGNTKQKRSDNIDAKQDGMRLEGFTIMDPTSIALANLPALPISRPQGRTSDIDKIKEHTNTSLTKEDALHISATCCTTIPHTQSDCKTLGVFAAQTVTSLSSSQISRPRIRHSNQGAAIGATNLIPKQAGSATRSSPDEKFSRLGTDSKRSTQLYGNCDSSSDISSNDEHELRSRPKSQMTAVTTSISTIDINSSDGCFKKLTHISKFSTPQGLHNLEGNNLRSSSPTLLADIQKVLTVPLPVASAASRDLSQVEVGRYAHILDRTDDLTKSDARPHLSMAVSTVPTPPLPNLSSSQTVRHVLGVQNLLLATQLGDVIDSSIEIQPPTGNHPRLEKESISRANEAESSMTWPHLQGATDMNYDNAVSQFKGESIAPDIKHVIVHSENLSLGTNQVHALQVISSNNSPGTSTLRQLPSFAIPIQSQGSYRDQNESMSDESEQSHSIVEGVIDPEICRSGEPNFDTTNASHAQRRENVIPQSSLPSKSHGITRQKGRAVSGSYGASSHDVDGNGNMNAWSVILSHPSRDYESTLLETSDVWAQNSSTTDLAAPQISTHDSPLDTQSRMQSPSSSLTIERHRKSETRSRNVTLVGDSDDEPRPPTISELWPEGAPETLSLFTTYTLNPLANRLHDEELYTSGTDESVTISGDSDSEPTSRTKHDDLLVTNELPAKPHMIRPVVVTQNLTEESECERSDDIDAKSPAHRTQLLGAVPGIYLHMKSDGTVEPATFQGMDYRPEQQILRHQHDEHTIHGLRCEDMRLSSGVSRNNSHEACSATSLRDGSGNTKLVSQMKEDQVQAIGNTGKVKRAAQDISLLPVLAVPAFHQSANLGSLHNTSSWASNLATRTKYQTTIDDINDEDSMPGAHPNCWSKESEEFSQIRSDLKTSIDSSSSTKSTSEACTQQYLNPFKTVYNLKSLRTGTSAAQCLSDDETAAYDFPSSDDNEEVRQYRSRKQAIYEDPDLSFDSALDENSYADDAPENGLPKEPVETNSEQKETLQKTVRADRYQKRRYRLEKGKDAVWGSASERDDRRRAHSLRKHGIALTQIAGVRKTVKFDIDKQHKPRDNTKELQPADTKLEELCQAYVEDIRDEDFLPGAHPNCEAPTDIPDTGEAFSQHDLESSTPEIHTSLKVRPTNDIVSLPRSGASSRQPKAKRSRNQPLLPLPDDDDEDLHQYRHEETAALPRKDAAPAWRSTRAYRNKKSKQRRFSHGEDEKFWDESVSRDGAGVGSSEDDWGEIYRSDNSRNSSLVGIGGCKCCIVEPQPRSRRQHYRSPLVIHHPELKYTNPFLPVENKNLIVAPQPSRRRSSIDPWSPDPPNGRRHRLEKTSDNPTYHVPDAPTPVLSSTRPEMPIRRRTENTESSPQASRLGIFRRRSDAVESMPQVPRVEAGRKSIRVPVRERSPTDLKAEHERKTNENNENSIQSARPDIGRRLSSRKQSPSRPKGLRRRGDAMESAPSTQRTRPEISRRKIIDRELSPPATRSEMPRRMTIDKEHKPKEKVLRFDIK